MTNGYINNLIKTLELQKDMFGDELYTKLQLQNYEITEQIPLEVREVTTEIYTPVSPIIMKEEKVDIMKSKISNKDKQLVDILNTEIDVNYSSINNLDEFNKEICNCTKCELANDRNKFVFGDGNPNADILIIGEGPGAEEDMQGKPFVGRAGQLLTKILEAINIKRDDVYIANIVKCRPPGNRVPTAEEAFLCMPYLKKQIEIIKPKAILGLGLTAATYLLGRKDSLKNIRGNVYDFQNAKLMITYHPAALLRNPNFKKDCWEDVQKFQKLFEDIKSENN